MPAERVLRHTEVAEVVVGVPGVSGDPADDEVVAVVGGVGAREPPEGENREHRDIGRPDREPARRQETLVAAAVPAVEDAERDQRDDRHEDAEHDRGELQQGRGADVAGVDGGAQRQPVTRDIGGQIAVDADDLGTHLVVGQREAVRGAGVRGRFGQALESSAHPLAVGPEDDATVRIRLRGRSIGVQQGDVAVGEGQSVGRRPDEEPAGPGVLAAFGDRRQQYSALVGQAGGECTWHRRLHVDRHEGDQRGGDIGDVAALRPLQFGGRLVHRQQRGEDRQQESEQTGDGRDDLRVDRGRQTGRTRRTGLTHRIGAPP